MQAEEHRCSPSEIVAVLDEASIAEARLECASRKPGEGYEEEGFVSIRFSYVNTRTGESGDASCSTRNPDATSLDPAKHERWRLGIVRQKVYSLLCSPLRFTARFILLFAGCPGGLGYCRHCHNDRPGVPRRGAARGSAPRRRFRRRRSAPRRTPFHLSGRDQ